MIFIYKIDTRLLHSTLALHSKNNPIVFNDNYVILKNNVSFLYMYNPLQFHIFQIMVLYTKLLNHLNISSLTLTLWEISRPLLYRRLGPRARFTLSCSVNITVAPHRTKWTLGCPVWRPRPRLASIWNQRNNIATELRFNC